MAIATGFLFNSCSESVPYTEDVYQNLWINTSPSFIEIDENNDGNWIVVDCQDEWYIASRPSWLNVGKTSGYSGEEIFYYADDNNEGTNRSGSMTIVTGSIIQKEFIVGINQQPTHAFDAIMYTTNYKTAGDFQYMYISSPATRSWTITKNDSWVHINNSWNTDYSFTGRGDKLIPIYVEENTKTTARYSTLTVTSGNKSKSITISQDAAETRLSVGDRTVYLSYSKSRNSNTFYINSNVSWRITKGSNGSWLSVTPTSGTGNGTITVSAGSNFGNPRETVLTIETTTGRKVTTYVTVHQY